MKQVFPNFNTDTKTDTDTEADTETEIETAKDFLSTTINTKKDSWPKVDAFHRS